MPAPLDVPWLGASGRAAVSNSSVEVSLPVRRHSAGRTRYRLVERMMLRRRKPWPVSELVSFIVPEPSLAWLEAPYHGVARGPGMTGGVLARRRVTAADVPASRAAPQVEPPTTSLQALDAPATARW